MSIEDRYLSGLVSVQFPDAPIAQPAAAEPSLDGVQLAMGGNAAGRHSDRPVSDVPMALLDMGAATAKGAVQGFAGLPGDLEGIGRMVLGAMGVQAGEKTVLPTTDEVKAWLDTKVGKVGDGKNPYESMGEVVAPGGQVKAVKAAGRGAKALAPKAAEMVIDSMDKLGSPVKIDLMAYHGTPHRVDRFDAAKIGTGEGNQAYGYGLYFAESPDVAKSYMAVDPSVTPPPIRTFKGKELELGSPEYHAASLLDGMSLAQARKEVAGWLKDPDPRMTRETAGWQKTLELLNEAGSKADFKQLKNKGNLYTVDIPDDMANKMLDFDARIGDQSTEVQALAQKLNVSLDDLGGDLLMAARGKTPQGARMMVEAGVPGVRYFDAGSRQTPNITNKRLEALFEKHNGDAEAAVDEMMKSVYNTPKNKDEMRAEFMRQLETPKTKNIVVFPGGEDEIKILKHEGNK